MSLFPENKANRIIVHNTAVLLPEDAEPSADQTDELPLDFGCACLYEATERKLTVVAVGLAASAPDRAVLS